MATGFQVTFDCADRPDFLASIGVPESQWGSASAAVDPDEKGPRLTRRAEERGEFWIVLQDPEGNEFCIQ